MERDSTRPGHQSCRVIDVRQGPVATASTSQLRNFVRVRGEEEGLPLRRLRQGHEGLHPV